MREFRPTWLYVKKHRNTGLMYFGKSMLKDPYLYNGSGKYWKSHLSLHGVNIDTIWCELFTDRDSLTDFAELFSSFFDIVKSDKWANLITENGLDGGSDKGRPGHTFSDESRMKISLANKGRFVTEETRQKNSRSLIGRKASEETKIKMRKSNRSSSEETRQKIREANTGRKPTDEHRRKMSEAARSRKRVPMSLETKGKISSAMKGRIPWNKGLGLD
jgi:hypothetical protein